MKIARPKYLVVGVLLTAASWFGYFISYLIHAPSNPAEINPHSQVMIKRLEKNAEPIVRPLDVHGGEFDDSRLIETPQNGNSTNTKAAAADHRILLESVRAKMIQQEMLKNKDWVEQNHEQEIKASRAHQESGQQEKPIQLQEPSNIDSSAKSVSDDKSRYFYSLIHKQRASSVHNNTQQTLAAALPQSINSHSYTFQCNKLPADRRMWPIIGNGHIATVVHSPIIHMNGLYNGFMNASHRARIPSPCSVNITATRPVSTFRRTYTLDVAQGVYSEKSVADQFTLVQRFYVHRNISALLVLEIDLVRTKLEPLSLIVSRNKWPVSYDLTFHIKDSGMEGVSYRHGRANAAETLTSKAGQVHVLYDDIPDELHAPASHKRIKWVFLTSVAHTKEAAFNAYQTGAAQLTSADELYASHVRAWSDVWSRGRVDVEGNMTVARAVYSSYYYILSSLPLQHDQWSSDFVGLSPSGLAYGTLNKDYQGHVFWDQETWMFPAILFFHADLARLLIGTRLRTAKAAESHAKHTSRQGMRFPWESAQSGFDVTPDKTCSRYEIHVNGDISFAMLQYLYATRDTSVLRADTVNVLHVLSGIAHFWVSCLSFNQRLGKYEINNVLPPDEDAGVHNNSVYTNSVARLSFLAVDYALKLLNKSEPRWKQFARDVYIPFDSALQYHPEYDGYVKGIKVKQADAVLLGYPLLQHMPQQVKRNDLNFYEKVTRADGPAMTWAMYSIGWLQLHELQQAQHNFDKNFHYIHPSFNVWSEEVSGHGAANFITGAGGFLQNVIFGYGGFELDADYLRFNPSLPAGVEQLRFVDIDLLGSAFDFFISAEQLIITLRRRQEAAPKLLVYVFEPEAIHTLEMNKCTKLITGKGVIVSADAQLPEPHIV